MKVRVVLLELKLDLQLLKFSVVSRVAGLQHNLLKIAITFCDEKSSFHLFFFFLSYYPNNAVPDNLRVLKLSGTEVRRRLKTGEEIPAWFSFPEVVKILRVAHPPRSKQGFCVFFTGLSGSGKTTVANALQEKLMEMQDRSVTMLDGDHVRQLLSKGLGFSREDRVLNIKRIG